MRAIVTGSSGFVGPHLIAHLQAEGDEVIGLDQQNGPNLLDRDGWINIVSDHQPDVIYHLAGWSNVGSSWDHPGTVFDVNAGGTLAVLLAARQCGSKPRVVCVSSADVYGLVQPEDLPLVEDRPPKPSSPYGASKTAAEALATQSYRGFGIETLIARPFNHVGPGQAASFAVSSWARQIADAEASSGGTIKHGNLAASRDITDVRDVVRAYRLLAIDGQPGETYNICSDVEVTMTEVLAQMVAMATVEVATQVDQALLRPVDLPALRGSFQKLHAATSWQPSIALATTLGDILRDARTGASMQA